MQTHHEGALVHIARRPWSFALGCIFVFALTLAFLWATDMLPESPAQNTQTQNQTPQLQAPAAVPTLPNRIVASAIGLDVAVVNPESVDIKTLDQALFSGAVRYPTSALLGAEGTMLIFGHSSALPVVRNQSYKTFNGIQTLKPGETISVYANGTEHRYRVVGVRLANAKEDVIELPQQGKHLVLVTCNSFATKSDRFVVTADFVGTF